jgi:2-phospho-L-lactate guanylyltransferase
MTIWAVVPVKPLAVGKSRLAQVLSDDARLALNHCLLSNTLATLKSMPELEHVLVVSRDPQALALARNLGARTLQEHGNPNLNVALERAMMVLGQYSTIGALILPADLPLINPADVRKLLALGKNPPVVGIAPDRHREGTNALLVSPLNLIPFSFGPGSFQRHCELARAASARLEVLESEALALDIDLPEDLVLVKNALDCGAVLQSQTNEFGG